MDSTLIFDLHSFLISNNLNEAAKIVHQSNVKNGWWHDLKTGKRLDRNKGELLMLTISELSEGMEGLRKSLMDDKLPHRKMIEVELADAKIRLLDFAGGFDININLEPSDYWVMENEALIVENNEDLIVENKAEGLLHIVAMLITLYFEVINPDDADSASACIGGCFKQIEMFATKFGYDVDGALIEKLEFNANREDHKPENRIKENGKKF